MANGTAADADALIRRFVAAWERRDTAAILECFTEDGRYQAMPLAPIVGKEALRQWVEHFADVPPPRLDVRHQVASADVVMNERTDHMTLNGKPVTLPICAVFELRDGLIAAWREYFDLGPARAAYAEDR